MSEEAKDGDQTDGFSLERLRRAREQALRMGGPEKVERLRQRGSLTARERIAALLDPDSFEELGQLAHSDVPEVREKTAADGKITGFGKIEGRTVYVGADDITVLAGAGGRVGTGKVRKGMAYATAKGYPCINLGAAGGARIPDIMGATGMSGDGLSH